MSHGKNSCYQSGCRLAECVTAHKVAMSRWRGRRIKTGAQLVPAEPAVRAARYAMAAGISWRDVSAKAGMSGRSLSELAACDHITRQTRARVLAVLATMLAEQTERIADANAAVRFAAGRDGEERTFPPDPLRDVLRGRMKGLLSEADRRYLYNGFRLSETRVKRICETAALNPGDIYPEWYGLEVVA